MAPSRPSRCTGIRRPTPRSSGWWARASRWPFARRSPSGSGTLAAPGDWRC
jgi:hypothetical protein